MNLKKYNLYIGSSTGSLKGVTVGTCDVDIKVVSKNLVRNKADLSNKNEITCMDWNGETTDEIIIGTRHKIRIFNEITEEFTDIVTVTDGDICGVFSEKESVFISQKTGIIKRIKLGSESTEITEHLRFHSAAIECSKRSMIDPNIIGVGGKDNNLKLWDLNVNKLVFAAKNIKPDELQLEVPVWVSNIAFARKDAKVAACMRHGYVRLYDPLLPQRRPVFNAYQSEEAFTCISGTRNDQQWLVGSSTGSIFLIDTRGKAPFVGKYKDCCGAIKSIVCPYEEPVVCSVSLDRHFRIHDFYTRKLLYKEYMQSRLTTILARTTFILDTFEEEEDKQCHNSEVDRILSKQKTNVEESEKDVNFLDKVFESMEKIEELKTSTKKRKSDYSPKQSWKALNSEFRSQKRKTEHY